MASEQADQRRDARQPDPAEPDLPATTLEGPPRREGAKPTASGWQTLTLLGTLNLAAVGLLVGARFLSQEMFLPAAVLAVVIVGVGILERWWIDRRRGPGSERWPRLVVSVGFIALGAASLVAYRLLGNAWDVIGVFAVTSFLTGAGSAMFEVRSSRWAAPYRGVVALIVSVALVVVGLVSLGDESWAVWALVLGVVAAPVGIGLVTEDLLDAVGASRVARPVAVLVVLGGLVLVVAGAGRVLHEIGTPVAPIYAIAGTIVVVASAGAVASRTSTDAAIALGILALAWSAAPRSLPDDDAVQPAAGDTVLVALGDSYISGEGTNRYYEQTNRKDVNECRRAPSAYPVKAVQRDSDAIPDRVLFLACSGARARNVVKDQLVELRARRDNLDLDLDLVVVSVGGNDAGFGDLARSCVAPGDCSSWETRWATVLDGLGPKLVPAYASIREEVGDDVPVVVVPYPVPLADRGCEWSILTDAEHSFLHRFTGRLNEVVRRTASDAGFYYLDEMATAFERSGMRLCDGRPGNLGVNLFAANPVEGLLGQQVNPLNWFHNSLHPNAAGHERMAEALADWMDQHPHLAGTRPGPSISSVSPGEAVGTGTDQLRQLKRDSRQWAGEQAVDFVRRVVPPLTLVFVGGWILWLAVFWWLRAVGFARLVRRDSRDLKRAIPGPRVRGGA